MVRCMWLIEKVYAVHGGFKLQLKSRTKNQATRWTLQATMLFWPLVSFVSLHSPRESWLETWQNSRQSELTTGTYPCFRKSSLLLYYYCLPQSYASPKIWKTSYLNFLGLPGASSKGPGAVDNTWALHDPMTRLFFRIDLWCEHARCDA